MLLVWFLNLFLHYVPFLIVFITWFFMGFCFCCLRLFVHFSQGSCLVLCMEGFFLSFIFSISLQVLFEVLHWTQKGWNDFSILVEFSYYIMRILNSQHIYIQIALQGKVILLTFYVPQKIHRVTKYFKIPQQQEESQWKHE